MKKKLHRVININLNFKFQLCYITTHCVERMNDRKINKGEMHVNLHTTPLFKTAVKTDIIGR